MCRSVPQIVVVSILCSGRCELGRFGGAQTPPCQSLRRKPRVARRLHIAQLSLSQAVRSLESELGVQLFHRVGRGVRLSAAGDALVGPARRVLRANDEARNAITDVTELNTGRLEIGALPTLAVDPMALFIAGSGTRIRASRYECSNRRARTASGARLRWRLRARCDTPASRWRTAGVTRPWRARAGVYLSSRFRTVRWALAGERASWPRVHSSSVRPARRRACC